MPNPIPLKKIDVNDLPSAEIVFGGGRSTPPLTYLGAPIHADFELSYAALAPYVNAVLDLAAPIEGAGLSVVLVEIKDGKVKVF